MRYFLALSLLLAACGAPPVTSQTAHGQTAARAEPSEPIAEPPPQLIALSPDGSQGVVGRVTVLRGNHMPQIYPADIPPPPQADPAGAPQADAPVHVLRGRHMPFERLDPGASFYLGSSTTGPDGTFRVALPPGEYTVLTEHEGQAYRNSFQPDGAWTTLTVTDGEWTEVLIQDSADATF